MPRGPGNRDGNEFRISGENMWDVPLARVREIGTNVTFA